MSGRRPLPVFVVIKVRLLLRRGWPHRRIAEELSIGKGSVQRIAGGVRVTSQRLPFSIICPDCGHPTEVSPCQMCGLAIPRDALQPAPDADRGLTTSQADRMAREQAAKVLAGGKPYTRSECVAKYFSIRIVRDPGV